MKRVATSGVAAALALGSVAGAEVPITIAATGHAVVPVEVAGRPAVTFVLDTGAQDTVLYRHFADELGLKSVRNEQVVGQTGATDVPVVSMPAFSVDGRSFPARSTVALPDRADGVRLNGILGQDVLREYLADIDYPRGRFSLRPASTDPRSLVPATAVPIRARRLDSGLMGFEVSVNGATGLAVLDSGSRDTRLNWNFARAAGISPDQDGLPDAGVIQGATNSAVSSKTIVLDRFVVAGRSLSQFTARAVDLPVFAEFGVADQAALILGHDVLKSARLVIDSSQDTVWFDWGAAP
jgi:predicted aspartyl protease